METVISNGATIAPFNADTAKAEMKLTLSKEGLIYQDILQKTEDIILTKDNLNDEVIVQSLKTVRSLKTKLEAMENPYTEAWKGFNAAKKSLVDPVVNALSVKESKYRELAEEVRKDAEKVKKENERIDGVKAAINEFILTQSQQIALAKTTSDLVAIEKLIGSHKANKSRYEEFLPDLVARTEELTPLIKNQKEAIKKLEDAKQKEIQARQSGDDQAVLDSMEIQEQLAGKMEDNKVIVQETAINQSVASSTSHRVVAPPIPKARRTTWKAEIVNVDEAIKKSRHLLDVTLNSEKISESIKTLKDSKVFDGKTEHIVNGIRYFEEKLY